MIAKYKSITAFSNTPDPVGVRCITSFSWDYRTIKGTITLEMLAGHTHDLCDRKTLNYVKTGVVLRKQVKTPDPQKICQKKRGMETSV